MGRSQMSQQISKPPNKKKKSKKNNKGEKKCQKTLVTEKLKLATEFFQVLMLVAQLQNAER